MNPIPVPNYLREAPWVDGTAVFAAPDGDLTSDQIPPAEGFFYSTVMDGYGDEQFQMVAVILELDEGEVRAIRAGAKHIMLSWQGRRMPVFIVPQVLGISAIEEAL